MYPTIMPPRAATETAVTEVVTPAVAGVLGITDHEDLFAGQLAGETPEEHAARLAAAEDILDDRLAEITHDALIGGQW